MIELGNILVFSKRQYISHEGLAEYKKLKSFIDRLDGKIAEPYSSNLFKVDVFIVKREWLVNVLDVSKYTNIVAKQWADIQSV